MLQERQRLNALLNQVSKEINAYLKQVNYQIFSHSEQDIESRGIEKAAALKWSTLEDSANNRTILVSDNALRNEALLTQRVLTMTKVKEFVDSEIKALGTNQNIDEQKVQDTVERLQVSLQSAIEKNNLLNNQYKKDHHTYRENRLAGMGMFSSWWHKTWFQSRAVVALESAVKHVDDFVKTYNLGKRQIEVLGITQRC